MATPQLLRYEEWEQSGQWYCNDTSDLTSVRSLWWAPARMLSMELDAYAQMLIDKFAPDNIQYSLEYNVLLYSWENQAQMRKFKNWINAEARKKKYII